VIEINGNTSKTSSTSDTALCHIFSQQCKSKHCFFDWTNGTASPSVVTGVNSNVCQCLASSNNKTLNAQMTKFKIFKEEIFILWELHSKILVGDKNLL
jgi:hypothetical protein